MTFLAMILTTIAFSGTCPELEGNYQCQIQFQKEANKEGHSFNDHLSIYSSGGKIFISYEGLGAKLNSEISLNKKVGPQTQSLENNERVLIRSVSSCQNQILSHNKEILFQRKRLERFYTFKEVLDHQRITMREDGTIKHVGYRLSYDVPTNQISPENTFEAVCESRS